MAQQVNFDAARLKQDWAVYTPRELKQRCDDFGSDDLIEGLLPDRSLSLLVGDSGLGKSALMYQMGLCVAAGVDFLGRKVRQGRVLIMDYENGLGQIDEMLAALAQHLGLSEAPDDLLIWNYNDCHPRFGVNQTASDVIREVQPTFTIIDSITALKPEIEEKNSEATRVYQTLRTIMRECGSSFLASHHRRKISDNGFSTPLSLENGNIRAWLAQARGAGALINGSDVRLGVDEPKSHRGVGNNDPALVMRGFARMRGEISSMYLARIRDDDGEPRGYEKLTGASLLFNSEQEETSVSCLLNFDLRRRRWFMARVLRLQQIS